MNHYVDHIVRWTSNIDGVIACDCAIEFPSIEEFNRHRREVGAKSNKGSHLRVPRGIKAFTINNKITKNSR